PGLLENFWKFLEAPAPLNPIQCSYFSKLFCVLIKKNPDEAKRILARDVGLDSETVKAVWPTYQFELTLQQSLLSTVQGQARWARREGHVVPTLAEPEFLNFIDSSPLRKIKPSAVDFVYP
ncbi:MAG: hypothetical protein ACK5Q1_15410, partial [Limnobacter sp.]